MSGEKGGDEDNYLFDFIDSQESESLMVVTFPFKEAKGIPIGSNRIFYVLKELKDYYIAYFEYEEGMRLFFPSPCTRRGNLPNVFEEFPRWEVGLCKNPGVNPKKQRSGKRLKTH
jgi:hypothetical protein